MLYPSELRAQLLVRYRLFSRTALFFNPRNLILRHFCVTLPHLAYQDGGSAGFPNPVDLVFRRSRVIALSCADAAVPRQLDKGVGKKGPGLFVLPGLMKIVVINKPAANARKGINPFTKEETCRCSSRSRPERSSMCGP